MGSWDQYVRAVRAPTLQPFGQSVDAGIRARHMAGVERSAAAAERERQRVSDAELGATIHSPGAVSSMVQGGGGGGGGDLEAQALAEGLDLRAPSTLEDLAIRRQLHEPVGLAGTPLEGTTADVASVRQYLTNPRFQHFLPEMSTQEQEELLSEYGDYRGDLMAMLGAERQARQGQILQGLRGKRVSEQMAALGLNPSLAGKGDDVLRTLAEAEVAQGAVSPWLKRGAEERQTAMSSAAGRREQRRLDDQYQNAVNIRADELADQAVADEVSARADKYFEESKAAGQDERSAWEAAKRRASGEITEGFVRDARGAAVRRASGELSPVYVDEQYKKSLQEGTGRSSDSDRGAYATRVNSVREMLESLPASKQFSTSVKDNLAVAAANDEVLFRQLTTKGATMGATDLVVREALEGQLANLVSADSRYSPEEEKINKWAIAKGFTFDDQGGEWIATQDLPELVFYDKKTGKPGSPQRGDFFPTAKLIRMKAIIDAQKTQAPKRSPR